MKYKENWKETQERFLAWWDRDCIKRPMLKIVARRKYPVEQLEDIVKPSTPEECRTNVEYIVKSYRNFCKEYDFLVESFPNIRADLGPGSMAGYLGCEANHTWDTVWFKECINEGYENYGKLKFDENNKFWKNHVDIIKQIHELVEGDCYVNIPDIVENLDILASLRGTEQLLYDLMDQPDVVKDYVNQIDNLYFKYYNAMYDIVKDNEGGSTITCFDAWGPGKTGKIQCDFSAMISPDQFRDFVKPSVEKQCKKLNHSVYHLDGVSAIKHLDTLLEIKELDAIQWAAGAGQPDAGNEKWYPIFDKIKEGNKSMWIYLNTGDFRDWIKTADSFIKRYGPKGIYFTFKRPMDRNIADQIIEKAENDWTI